MPLLNSSPVLTFTSMSSNLAPDLFTVLSFEGTEGLSQCYEFDILLLSSAPDVDLQEVQSHPALFSMIRPKSTPRYHGVLEEFEQLQSYGPYTFYRAKLIPRLRWARFAMFNRVFVDKGIEDFLGAALKSSGLNPGADFEFKLKDNHGKAREYVCQYRESNFDFLCRWLEREGIYYYFEQKNRAEKLVFVDSHVAHKDLPGGAQLRYAPPSGLDHARRQETVSRFSCRHMQIPSKVTVQDYNYRTPGLDVRGDADVAEQGMGQFHFYNEHSRNPKEAKRLAKIRAEEQLCRRQVFQGESTSHNLSPGYRFKLEGHYRKDFNQAYLVVAVRHEGSQAAALDAGLSGILADHHKGPAYRNSFQAIPASVQYRPIRATLKPRISGPLNAFIDASGAGQYAELDEMGRYTVRLPFDSGSAAGGKASAKLRMAQPYAGSNQGMHFPLLKKTEVVLTFVDGDPDRPIIQSVAPNPETKSVVAEANHTKNMIQTAGRNKIQVQDQGGKESIVLNSTKQETWIRLGAPNDPPPPDGSTGSGDSAKSGYFLSTKGNFGVYGLGNYDINIGGLQTTKVFLSVLYNELITGQKTGIVLGRNSGINIWKMEANATLAEKYEGSRFWAGATRSLLWGSKNWAEGKQSGATGQKSEAIGSETKAKSQKTEGVGTKVEAKGTNTQAKGAETEATGTREAGTGTEVEAQGTQVRARSASVPVTGAQSTSVGADQENTGAEQANLGARQRSASVEMKTAASGMHASGGPQSYV